MPIEALLAIVGMALVTYATRLSGIWVVARMQPSERVTAWLRYIPGTVLISLAAPSVLDNGAAGVGAAAVTTAVALKIGNPLVAMVVGVATLLVLRWLIGLH